jgi:histidine triad (HIT) family protein
VLVFEDIDPKAPTHLIAIPKEHILRLPPLPRKTVFLIAHIFEVIGKLSSKKSLKNGFRVVTNCGDDGGQTWGHLHFHLLGGRAMHWPPG